MGWPDEVDIDYLKEALLRYVKHHPFSQDTLDEVLQWWLVRHRVMAGLNWLQEPRSELYSDGHVAKVTGQDGQ